MSTWSSWLGIDAEGRAKKDAAAKAQQKIQQEAAVVELRALFDSEEGRLCARQLAAGAASAAGRGGAGGRAARTGARCAASACDDAARPPPQLLAAPAAQRQRRGRAHAIGPPAARGCTATACHAANRQLSCAGARIAPPFLHF